MTKHVRTLGTLVAAALIAGCGGGLSTPPTAAVGTAPSRAITTAKITIVVPAQQTAARARHPAYVSSSTQSMTIAVNGGTPLAVNLTPSSPGCVAGPTTCTVSVDAPVGTDTFAVKLYDAAGGTGNALSSATVQQTIVANAGNTIRLTLGGIVQTIAIAPGNGALTFNAGTPQTFDLTLAAKDAQGNTIVGPGGYLDANGAPLSVALSAFPEQGSGTRTLALSTTTITGPADSAFRMSYNGRGLDGAVLTAQAAGGLNASVTITAIPTVILTTQSPTNSSGMGLAGTADGSLWVAESGIGANDYIARVTPAGVLTEFPVTGNISPNGITVGSDGNLWFAEANSFNIGRLTPSGTFTQFPVTFGIPTQIALGADGNVWAAYESSGITKMTTAGVSTDYSTGFVPGSILRGLAAGPDGRMWVCDQGSNAIDAVTSTGTFTSYAIPSANAKPSGIAATAPGTGKLWFTEAGTGKIASITTSGVIAEFSIPGPGPHVPQGITLGTDEKLWFVDRGNATIGSFTPGPNTFAAYPSTASSLGFFIASDVNGALWYTDGSSRTIITMVY